MAYNPSESHRSGSSAGNYSQTKQKGAGEEATYTSPDAFLRTSQPKPGGTCPNCGASHSATAQICPECGMSLGGNQCTFCGHPLPPGASECRACGASREGVECPDCGTINFRNFCRNCNRPITKGGEAALAKFRANPQFQAAQKINDSLSKLADFIDGKISASDPDIAAIMAEAAGQKTEGQKTEDQTSKTRKPLFISKLKPKPMAQQPIGAPGLAKPASKAAPAAPMTIEEAMKLYEQKRAEMEGLLDSILPDADSTPEEQRDFYSARMTVVTRTYKKLVEEPVAWICNFCGFRHNKPQECAEPWHGGTWVHETHEITYEVSTLEKME